MARVRMQIYFQELGGHTHIKVFTGRDIDNGTLGKAGDLCMTNEEFQAWRNGTANVIFSESKNTVVSTNTAVPIGASGAK